MEWEKCVKKKSTWLGIYSWLFISTLILNSVFIANAQTKVEPITHSGESGTLAITFVPPIEFFENINSPLDQFLHRRNAQLEIAVIGAGASYQVGTAQPLPDQKMRRVLNRIEVQGAGSVRDVGIMVSPVEVTVNDLVITAIGAGSVRNTQLERPVVEK